MCNSQTRKMAFFRISVKVLVFRENVSTWPYSPTFTGKWYKENFWESHSVKTRIVQHLLGEKSKKGKGKKSFDVFSFQHYLVLRISFTFVKKLECFVTISKHLWTALIKRKFVNQSRNASNIVILQCMWNTTKLQSFLKKNQ